MVLGGIPVARLDADQTLELLTGWLESPRPRRVVTANLTHLYHARRPGPFRRALQTADLVTADGVPLLWLARLAGTSLPQRVTGSDLAPRLVARAARLGRRVHLLGAPPQVSRKAAELLSSRHPGLAISTSAPLLPRSDRSAWTAAAAEVRRHRPELLLVALGAPKQELFCAYLLPCLGCRVAIGVGATLDFIAGRVARAPRQLQQLGLEWLFRLIQEPHRLTGRYAGQACFLLSLIRSTVARQRTSRSP